MTLRLSGAKTLLPLYVFISCTGAPVPFPVPLPL